MIQFKDKDGIIGTIEYVDGKLIASNSLRSIVDLWQHRGNDASDFESAYDGWSNGYVSGQRVLNGPSNVFSESVVAAARDDKRDGAMIALVPRAEDAERLALEDFEPPDELHVTLFYLGDAVNITSAQIDQLVAQLHQDVQTSERQVPIFTQAFGVAHWNPESDYPAWVLNVGDAARDDPAGLTALRDSVERSVNGVGIDYPPQHSPWQPHICIAYSKDDLYGELASRLGKLTFDTLRVAWGEYDIDIPLVNYGNNMMIAATSDTAFHLPGQHNQKSHGNRKGKSGNITSDKAKSSTDKSNTKPKASSAPKKSFAERVADAKTGNAALTSAPIHNRKTLDAATMEEREAYPGANYKREFDVPLNGVPGRDVRDAISDYGNNGYQNINWALRASGGDDDAIPDTHPTSPGTYSAKRTKDGIVGIDAAMKASSLENDVVVYRGIADPAKTFGSAWRADGDNTGLRFTDSAYASTTVSKTVVGTFAGYGAGVAMKILVPKGTQAIGIEQGRGSGLSHEQELLLDRNLVYNVVRDYEEKGVRTIDVEVVN